MFILEIFNLGIPELVMMVILPLTVLASFVLGIYCLVNILRSKFKEKTHQLLFIILVVFAPFVGSIIYLIIREKYIESSTQVF